MPVSKQMLADALRRLVRKNSLDKISVDRIISEAQVSRQTFYKLFPDKYALAFWVYLQDIQPALEEYESSKDYDAMNSLILRQMRKERLFYRNLFKNPDSPGSFHSRLHNFSVDNTLEMIGHSYASPQLEKLVGIWRCGTEQLISRWLQGGAKEEAGWMADVIKRAMPPELRSLLYFSPGQSRGQL